MIDPQIFLFMTFAMDGFQLMGRKARKRTTLRRQFTFYHYVSAREIAGTQYLSTSVTNNTTTDPEKGVSVVAKMLFPHR